MENRINNRKNSEHMLHILSHFYQFLLLALSVFLSSYFFILHAIEIPLNVSEGKKTNIAFVDMELVYNISLQKSKGAKEHADLKNNYEMQISSLTALLEHKKNELLLKELEIKASQDKSSVMPSEEADRSTATLANLYEKELTKKLLADSISQIEKELSTIKKKMTEELSAMEKQFTTEILEHIYKILEAIAVEEELTLIIDKNYILYGPMGYDITHKVIERLK